MGLGDQFNLEPEMNKQSWSGGLRRADAEISWRVGDAVESDNRGGPREPGRERETKTKSARAGKKGGNEMKTRFEGQQAVFKPGQ